jgi:hypothetical protein
MNVNKSANNVDEVCKERLVSIHQQRERKAAMSRINQITDTNTRAFAEACYDQNSLEELRQPFCPSDKRTISDWNITKSQWGEAVAAALFERLED